MSTMTMASSSLNPNAPLYIPAAYRRVEDFSPEWWELVQTTAWFRDHWFRQHHHHQLHDEAAQEQEHEHDAALAALPDDLLDDTDHLFYAPQPHQHQEPDPDAALRVAPSSHPWELLQQQLARHADKHVGLLNEAPARHRGIYQPR